jgi:hypothetical protein
LQRDLGYEKQQVATTMNFGVAENRHFGKPAAEHVPEEKGRGMKILGMNNYAAGTEGLRRIEGKVTTS